MNEVILALDVGSTTTKARLFHTGTDCSRVVAVANTPTTVEEPHEDVMVGVRRAVERLERQVDSSAGLWNGEGVDALVACSSAGGGLQMLVTGVWRKMTAESARRAALGAGAVILDVHHVNDGLLPAQRVARMRAARPDMVLMTGGTEGGQINHLIAMAEWMRAARPRPRFGQQHRIPLVYAGNTQALPFVRDILSDVVQLHVCENLRPSPETENLAPVREVIHELFTQHVMARAPGYSGLIERVDAPVLPTPGAFGLMIKKLAERLEERILAVDIGGATTDVFSTLDGEIYRTVSANLGMSYSIMNVFSDSEPGEITRWLPYPVRVDDLREWAAAKMIRPTTLPNDLDDLLMEHAFARQALHLALEHHRERTAVGFPGTASRTTGFAGVETPGDMARVGTIIGSGGVLSHAGDMRQAAGILIDGLAPEGLTRILIDRGFMVAHLGALSMLSDEAALALLEEVLVCAGWCISPIASDVRVEGLLGEVEIRAGGGARHVELRAGRLEVVELPGSGDVQVTVKPQRGVNLGAAPGEPICFSPTRGILVLDGRLGGQREDESGCRMDASHMQQFGYAREQDLEGRSIPGDCDA